MSATTTTVGGRARVDDDRPDAAYGLAAAVLVLVGVGFLVLQLLVAPRGLSTDEVTYLAKVDPAAPELNWTAPRAWGIPVLAAPVALFSLGLEAVRQYFAVLTSAGLVAAFWPWLRVLRPAVPPVAAFLLATTWVTVFLGSLVMPNLVVALGAVAVVGLYLRSAQQPESRRAAAGVTVAAALVALVRPTDSVLVVGPLVALGVLLPRLRRRRPLRALVAGELLGWLPWVVEAYVRFGGPLHRLRSGADAGPHGLALHLSTLSAYPRLLDGRPNYCCFGGPASDAGPLPPVLTGWLVALPLLAMLGLVLAGRGRRMPLVLVLVPSGLLAAFYLLLPSFVTPRFLLPALALIMLPVAVALVAAAGSGRGRRRRASTALVAVLLVGQAALMLPIAIDKLGQESTDQSRQLKFVTALRPVVAGRPCLLVGDELQVAAYELRCQVQRAMPTRRPPGRVRQAAAEHRLMIAVLREPPARHSYLARWPEVTVPLMPRAFDVHVAPS